MVTRALLVTFNWVSVAPVNNTHPTRPLARGLDTDVLGGGDGGCPERIFRCQGIPDANRVVQTELGIVTHVAWMQSFQGLESVRHESGHPFGERGASVDERGYSGAELAAGQIVSQSDVQWEQAESQLATQFGWVRWKQGAFRGRQS